MRILFALVCSIPAMAMSQFAPAAGKPGSTALRGDSSCFVAWASACVIQRGLMDISQPDSGYATVGTEGSALGPAKQNGVVSLGDGGSATLSFPKPITNGPGWDFAIFENTFLDTFLELAFVEVSTDGTHYVRFPALSYSDTQNQTGPFGATYPEKVHNLAGKYIVGYGTPFDLEELKDSANLDVNDVRFVRVIDVVGSILDDYSTRDSKGNKINDPWPTLFPSAGFDLDAVGVIHQQTTSDLNYPTVKTIAVWPNPGSGGHMIVNTENDATLHIYATGGNLIETVFLYRGQNDVNLSLPAGMYYFSLGNKQETIPYIVLP